MKYTEEEKQIMADWPTVTERDLVQLNELFQHYLFYRHCKTGGEVKLYASCCGHRETRPYLLRTETPADRKLMGSLRHKHRCECPWCGHGVTAIDLGKAKGRKTLQQTELTVLLHSKSDALYADALVLWKPYETEEDLTARPFCRISSGYRLRPGEVMQLDHQRLYGDEPYISYECGKLGRKKNVQEPFKSGCISFYSHESYSIVNADLVRNHPFFRYCGFFDRWQYRPGGARGYRHYFDDLISYLTAYAIYPRQIEMLGKAEWWEPIHDLIYDRRKNAHAMCWEETDPRKAFRTDGQGLKALLEEHPSMSALEIRNYVKARFGVTWTAEDCRIFENLWGCYLKPMKVLQFLSANGINPDRFLRYCGKIHDAPFEDLFELYKDYYESAYALGRCMTHSKVLWPEDLNAAHDEAAAALDLMETAVAMEKGSVKGKARKEKYEFESDGLRVVFPVLARQIEREGRALHHCVGGYADRHINNVLTILFLRKSDAPGVPYVTIEMHGNQLRQIHGWDDERTACPENQNCISPRERHRAFLDKWLDWLKRGSPRNADGTPKLSAKKKTEKQKEAVA